MISWNAAGKAPGYRSGWKSGNISDLNRIAKCMSNFIWSPIVWHPAQRCGDNFKAAEFCVLDFDDGEMTLDEAVNNVFTDMQHVIGTTRNHRKEKRGITCDRFRVLLRFDKPIVKTEVYVYNMLRQTDKYPCDGQCKDAARFFYPCAEIVSINDDQQGFTVDVAKPPAGFQKSLKWSGQQIPPPPWLAHVFREPWREGYRNIMCWRVSLDLFKSGFSAEEIYCKIRNSPTYQGPIDPRVDSKIKQAIKSAFKHLTGAAANERRCSVGLSKAASSSTGDFWKARAVKPTTIPRNL